MHIGLYCFPRGIEGVESEGLGASEVGMSPGGGEDERPGMPSA